MDVSPLWAILFFFMLLLLGIDSEFGTLEAAVAPFFDMKLVKMKKPVFMGKPFSIGLSHRMLCLMEYRRKHLDCNIIRSKEK